MDIFVSSLATVIAHIHYFPDQWRGEGHTYSVRAELDML